MPVYDTTTVDSARLNIRLSFEKVHLSLNSVENVQLKLNYRIIHGLSISLSFCIINH